MEQSDPETKYLLRSHDGKYFREVPGGKGKDLWTNKADNARQFDTIMEAQLTGGQFANATVVRLDVTNGRICTLTGVWLPEVT